MPDFGVRESHEVKENTRAKTASAFSISKSHVFGHDPFKMCESRYEWEKERLKRICVKVSTPKSK